MSESTCLEKSAVVSKPTSSVCVMRAAASRARVSGLEVCSSMCPPVHFAGTQSEKHFSLISTASGHMTHTSDRGADGVVKT